MIKYATIAAFVGLSFLPAAALAQGTSGFTFSPAQAVSITNDGHVVVGQATVIQVSGTTVYAQSRFGNAPLRWLLPTNASTKVQKRFGGSMTVADIVNGDLIDFSGSLNGASDSLSVTADRITDWSRTDEQSQVAGLVTAVSTTSAGFVLDTGYQNYVTVLSGATTTITKGKLTISLPQIKPGDKIISVQGVLDVPSKTLQATTIVVYQDQSIFYPHNFQGTLKSIDTTANPLIMVLTIGAKDYTVNVPANAPILNAARNSVSVGRFMVGDTVRVYGAIEQTNLNAIDAELVRNVNL